MYQKLMMMIGIKATPISDVRIKNHIFIGVVFIPNESSTKPT
jgi:hypothetical protein